jgi:hypothetical protein
MSTEAAAPVAPVVAPEAAPQQAAEPALDTRLAALSRREREIQQQQAAFKQERAGMVSKAELADLWKKDRSKLREYLGVSPEEWNIPEPQKEQVDPLQSMRAELDAMKQAAVDKEMAASEAAFKEGISSFVKQGAEAYELISAYNATETVWNFMVEYYQEKQVELSLKEACDYVEEYLFSQLKTGTGTKKVGSLFQQSQEPGKQPSPTLTGAAAANPAPSTQRHLSQEESLVQAAKLIKWN